MRAGTALAAGALTVTAVGCGSSGGDATFTPAAAGSRTLPSVAPFDLPPLDKFIRLPDGSLMSSVNSDYLFDVGSDKLLPDAAAEIEKIVPAIQTHDGPVQILGFTDGVGDVSYNQDLSQRRADAVKDILVQAGVRASQLQAVGKGADGAPAGVPDSTRRKVEIVLK
jgi:outer membrane protein OmpA-like peptidoglycan-associated protein